MAKSAAVIKGDGVDPDLVEAMLKVSDAANSNVEFITCDAGAAWWENNVGNSLLPDDTCYLLDSSDACYKGPTTIPGVVGASGSMAVSIRQKYDLYVNITIC